MEWIAEPTAWLGLGTLILLEIVLGVDNLIFIAILVDKLPPHLRNRARIIGLSLALFMRVAMLAGISWLQSLTAPVLTLFGNGLSVRDLILIAGGLFLLVKATTELHGRLEGGQGETEPEAARPGVFWQTIVQIVILDFVFSIDSVVTAVGMVDHLSMMVIAVFVAIVAMMFAQWAAHAICQLPSARGDPRPRVPADDRLQLVCGRMGLRDPEGVSLCRDRLLGDDRDAQPDRFTQPAKAGASRRFAVSHGRSRVAYSGKQVECAG